MIYRCLLVRRGVLFFSGACYTLKRDTLDISLKRTEKYMERNNKLYNRIKIFACSLSLILTGCSTIGLAQDATFESAYENLPEEEAVDIYISQSTVIIESIDEAGGTVTAYLTDRNESKTFTYTGACTVEDKYGNPMSIAQLKPGDICDFAYNSELERVGRISLTADAWIQESVAKYTLNLKSRNISIGEEVYSLSEKAKVFSDGQVILPEEILRNDVLTFYGRGNTVLSIIVDKGHGYIDLTNEENFIGGWIEVGQTVIAQIEEDMFITVPEGSYTVRLTSGSIEEIREITIVRNEETVLDLGNVEFPKAESGRVVFKVYPEDAVIYVDDEKINTDYIVKLPFGMHRITAEAEGYDTLSEYFEVEGETTTVKMTLTESSSVSGNSAGSSKKEGAMITIDVPQEVEVYQDNLYMGIAPVTYEKKSGTHIITLRKNGYITKSYEIQVPDDNTDVTYSFSALDPEGSTVSGNSIGGNTDSNKDNGNSSDTDKKVNSNSASSGSISDDSVEQVSVTDDTVSGNSISGNSAEQIQ